MELDARRTPADRRTIPALHERDLKAILGIEIPPIWSCSVCHRTNKVSPAAYMKKAGGLEPLCFTCLMDLRK